MGSKINFRTNYTTDPPTSYPTTGRVQRLLQKPETERRALASRIFGGSMLGLSTEGWKLCQSIFDFDYMGAAEYEFGAIPQVLRRIVGEAAEYRPWQFVIKGVDAHPGWWRRDAMDSYRRAELREAKEKKTKPPRMSPAHKKHLAEKAGAPIPDTTIYVVSHKEVADTFIETLIRMINKGEVQPKNGAHFDLDRAPDSYLKNNIGWLDLDNELLWFTDKDTFDAFVSVFEIGLQGRGDGCSTPESSTPKPVQSDK